jgi:SAM-dependent methyltransferase
MKQQLEKIYRNAMFFPGILGLFLNPFYFARKGLAEHISALSSHISGKILDVGCGKKPYQQLFQATEYIGLEYDSPENRKKKHADFYYDGRVFPFESNSFDSLVINQVFEHVFNPDDFLKESLRVLKPGGKLLMTVPFVWDEHEQPHDFARYSSFGLQFILEKHGFNIVEQRKSVNDFRVIFQLVNAYLYKKMMSSNPYLNLVIAFFVMFPINVAGEIIGFLLPDNNDLYLDNVILARKN